MKESLLAGLSRISVAEYLFLLSRLQKDILWDQVMINALYLSSFFSFFLTFIVFNKRVLAVMDLSVNIPLKSNTFAGHLPVVLSCKGNKFQYLVSFSN